MKKVLRFFAMLICCFVTAMALIYIMTADQNAVADNLAWTAAGTIAFILAILANPFRTEPEMP